MRTILCVLYVFLFLVLGLPVLGVEWLIAKRHKNAADISQLLRAVIIRRYRLSATSVRILDIIKMSRRQAHSER